MKNILNKKFNIVIVLAAIFAVFAVLSAVSFVGKTAGVSENVAFAEEEPAGITILETKAKVSLDRNYLLLVTGFDPTNLQTDEDAEVLYYIGYKYTVGETEYDTARAIGAEAATYYASVTLRTDLEDPAQTEVVTPAMIYGEGYEDYRLIVYEIEFTDNSCYAEKADYSDIYAYIDEVSKDDPSVIVNSFAGKKCNDSTKDVYRVKNGDFENGLTGWTVENDDDDKPIGNVITTTKYWKELVPFNQHGDRLFSAYTTIVGDYIDGGSVGDAGTGTLTSSKFTIGGSGWMTFKFGGARHYDQVYFEVVEDVNNDGNKENDVVLARYYNSEWTDADTKGCQLNQYRADLSDFLGKNVYIRITDNGTGDYGLFFVDDIVTYYETAPTIGTVAENILVNVVNGRFEKGFYGWTMRGEYGDIGEISEEGTFWKGNDINKEGKYFRGDLNGKEGNTGTLTSADFVVSGSGFITFRLGAANNENCYITLEKKTNKGYDVVAVWHNNYFVDEGDGSSSIGNGLRLVQYKADLSDYNGTDYTGETMRIVLHDEATGGFGFFTFDEFKTYYATEPDGNLIENQMTYRATLLSTLDGETITEQGDYTTASYDAYVAAKNAASNLGEHSKIATITSALASLATAKGALAYRTPSTISESSARSFVLVPEGTEDVTIAEHVDENDLSSVSYSVASGNTSVATVSAITDGAFTITAVADGTTTVTLSVIHHEENVHTVTFAVTVSTVPTLNSPSVSEDIDLYSHDSDCVLDFTANVANLGDKELTYSATMKVGNGEAEAISLTNNGYTYTCTGDYNDVAVVVTFAVTVSYDHNGTQSLDYNYVLNITDSTDYRMANGGFENGLDGWTLSNEELGAVRAYTTYWSNRYFYNEGNFFSAYTNEGTNGQDGNENAKGSLTSPTFKIGGSGWITYKFGAAKTGSQVWIDVVDSTTGEILGRYWNELWGTTFEYSDCSLVPYKVDLSGENDDNMGKTVYLRVVDDGTIGDYRLFFLDSVKTYYKAEPSDDDFNEATPIDVVYQLYNGGFENGASGWDIVTVENRGGAFAYVNTTNEDATWGSSARYNNDGPFLSNIDGSEQSKGYALSSVFAVSANGWISFKLGGNKAYSYVAIIDAFTSEILAKFVNEDFEGGWPTKGWEMHAYKTNLKTCGISTDRLVRILIVDASFNDFGVIVADSFVTYYNSEPDTDNKVYKPVSDVYAAHKYEIINGGFELGNLNGWMMSADLGAVTASESWQGWYHTNDGDERNSEVHVKTKEGDYLFTFYLGGEDNREGGRGYLRSSVFVLKAGKYISFRFGAAHNENVYIKLCKADGTVIAIFRNNAYLENTVMVQYCYLFEGTEDTACYFEVWDDANSGYGCFVVDDFRVNLDAAPEGAVLGSAKTKAERDAE